MKFSEFKQSLKNGVSPIYLTVGQDAFFKDEIASVLTQLVDCSDFDSIKLDGANVRGDYNSFLSNLYSYPMMSKYRLVIVDDFYPSPGEFENKLSKYFKEPQDTTILLIRNGDKCDQLAADGVCVIDLTAKDKDSVRERIRSEIESRGKKINFGAAEKIAVYSLYDMAKVMLEIQKLLDYCYDKDEITEADVDNAVTVDNEFAIYEMTQALGKRNTKLALCIIEDLLAKNESPQRLFVSIYNAYRRMFFCAISPKSDEELAKDFGVKPYAVKKTRETARAYKKKELKEILEKMAESDYKFKSGYANAYDAFINTVYSVLNGSGV